MIPLCILSHSILYSFALSTIGNSDRAKKRKDEAHALEMAAAAVEEEEAKQVFCERTFLCILLTLWCYALGLNLSLSREHSFFHNCWFWIMLSCNVLQWVAGCWSVCCIVVLRILIKVAALYWRCLLQCVAVCIAVCVAVCVAACVAVNCSVRCNVL